MNKLLSTSAQDSSKYYWMRYNTERATVVNVKGAKVRIEKGTLFGIRELRGKSDDEVMLVSGQVFRLAINRSEQLMNRSVEYRGKVKLKPAAPSKSPIVVKPTPTSPYEKKYIKLVSDGGLTVANFKRIMPLLKDDAERLHFKQWLLSKIARGSAKYKAVLALVTNTSKPSPKIIIATKPVARVTKLSVPATQTGPVMVKLSQVEMPEEDEFHDHELPEEFRKYATVESSVNPNYFAAISMCLNTFDSESNGDDFNAIIKHTLEPSIHLAKNAVEKAIQATAVKVKAWAIHNIQSARSLGRRTDLFEKLLNDPVGAVRQLANVMLGVKPQASPVEVAKQAAEEKELDDLLANIKF